MAAAAIFNFSTECHPLIEVNSQSLVEILRAITGNRSGDKIDTGSKLKMVVVGILHFVL